MKYFGDKTRNKFLKDTFNSYIDITTENGPRNNVDILASPLWYNPDISYKLFLRSWSKLGLNFVSDILDKNGK